MRNESGNRTSRSRSATLVALLATAALLLPEVALADGDPGAAGPLWDTSDDRIPAVTAFPKYPAAAYRERLEGEATVCFAIDRNGRIVRPSVRSSSHRIFDKAAMRAIRDSSFEPLDAGAKLAVEKTCRTYRFRLDPVKADSDGPSPVAGVAGAETSDAEDVQAVSQE